MNDKLVSIKSNYYESVKGRIVALVKHSFAETVRFASIAVILLFDEDSKVTPEASAENCVIRGR